ncbi:hypothetical protein TSUD_376670 [Trifolium subterraneum]|uniref:Uncharacterized protein n=1 Tax=Trifolium subterraneum TaxID=3900 RepID=A0A2Z6PH05_TRISU|nr:hypothetical protein TSUD_376670 [Trifolium subterraneum]
MFDESLRSHNIPYHAEPVTVCHATLNTLFPEHKINFARFCRLLRKLTTVPSDSHTKPEAYRHGDAGRWRVTQAALPWQVASFDRQDTLDASRPRFSKDKNKAAEVEGLSVEQPKDGVAELDGVRVGEVVVRLGNQTEKVGSVGVHDKGASENTGPLIKPFVKENTTDAEVYGDPEASNNVDALVAKLTEDMAAELEEDESIVVSQKLEGKTKPNQYDNQSKFFNHVIEAEKTLSFTSSARVSHEVQVNLGEDLIRASATQEKEHGETEHGKVATFKAHYVLPTRSSSFSCFRAMEFDLDARTRSWECRGHLLYT